jgi:hypothetical protein
MASLLSPVFLKKEYGSPPALNADMMHDLLNVAVENSKTLDYIGKGVNNIQTQVEII